MLDLKEFHEVNESGEIVETHIFSPTRDDIPANCFEGWGDREFHRPRWDWDKREWIESKTYGEKLEEAKKAKDVELNTACEREILSGFDFVINGETYKFSFDTEAQLNFQGAERLFSNGSITELSWTAKQGGEYVRITIDTQVMQDLTIRILEHKNGNIAKYRDILSPMVKEAQTIEEVQSISWDSAVIPEGVVKKSI